MKQLGILIITLLLPAFAFATPNNPSTLTLTNVTSHSVTLNWQDNSDNETGFKILVNGKYLLKTAPDVTHFTVDSLTPNTHYEFTVKATDSDYENNRATLSTDSQTYNENEDIVVNIKNLVNDRDYWVGIYPKDASHDWANMIDWNRPLDQTTLTFDGIAVGEYEARLFYSSSFELLEKVAFSVSNKVSVSTNKRIYDVNESIVTKFRNLVQDEDNWVGIYPKDASNDWANMIKWNRPLGQTTLTFEDIVSGEYEARLFYSSAFILLAKVGFSVQNDAIHYGELGTYDNKVQKINLEDGKIYYVEGTPNLPTIAFLGGLSDKHDGLCSYMASWGYNVIATEFPWGQADQILPHMIALLTEVHDTYHADISTLGIVGKSYAGGMAFHTMKALKDQAIAGTTKSALISLDGWFPFEMNQEDMHSFTTPSLIVQYGGADGIDAESGETSGLDYYQDPNINITLFNELRNVETKSFIFLEADNTHGYNAGDKEQMQEKLDLLKPMHIFLNHTLKNIPDVYNAIDQTNDIIRNNNSTYRYACDDPAVANQFNFCDLANPIYK